MIVFHFAPILTYCFYPGFVERVNQMKRAYYVTIVLATPIMKVMMLRFIMHKLEVVAIVAMPMRGIQRGEFIIFDLICFAFIILIFFVLTRRCPFLSSFADSAISMEVKMVKGHHLVRPLPRLNQLC